VSPDDLLIRIRDEARRVEMIGVLSNLFTDDAPSVFHAVTNQPSYANKEKINSECRRPRISGSHLSQEQNMAKKERGQHYCSDDIVRPYATDGDYDYSECKREQERSPIHLVIIGGIKLFSSEENYPVATIG
jgi:hypothetical protein